MGVFVKKVLLNILENSQENTSVSLFFDKVPDVRFVQNTGLLKQVNFLELLKYKNKSKTQNYEHL